ncbi:hypothetical protein DW681_12465 [Thomasclavelia ramosa]|jgi:hypothetical protein|uniref:hypothetical protein n=1 Tax=Thomasclavelia ramosa TaxID=1547 RepID=UPI000E4E8B1C|nr:hypothetical protein [Thomasclavelia ramosa]RHF40941.1 hypothetical protein DW681_12465 [Thomasclavelia ramosa]
MNKSEKRYKDEIINKEDVLNELISLNDKSALFAVLLDDSTRIKELEYQVMNDIRLMIENDDYIFIKRTEI